MVLLEQTVPRLRSEASYREGLIKGSSAKKYRTAKDKPVDS
jgi:hypothetical protein